MSVYYLLNATNQLSIGRILGKTCPVDITFVLTNFFAKSQYRLDKPKNLEICMQKHDLDYIMSSIGNDHKVINCTSERQLRKLVNEDDICLSRGREFFILKPFCHRNIAVSLNRCYFNRLLDVLPHYNDPYRLEVVLSSQAWLDPEKSGSFMMGRHSYGMVDTYRDSFITIDVLGYYINLLTDSMTHDSTLDELGIDDFAKTVFVSLRQAQKEFSIYNNTQSYASGVCKHLEKLKSDGYYVFARRRLGRHDIQYYNVHRSPEYFEFEQFEPFIDKEVNGFEGFPEILWRVLYFSDLMYLSDISGIAYLEAALSRCPVFLPQGDKMPPLHTLSPAIRDMVEKGLMLQDYSDDSMHCFNDNIHDFIATWFNTDTDAFWERVLR